MPLRSGKDRKTISGNISEFHKGSTYARTRARFGKADADKQAVAAALRESGKSRKKKKG